MADEGAQPQGLAQSNPRHLSHQDVTANKGAQVYYRPETNELLLVPAESSGAFESECRLLDLLVHDFQTAKADYYDLAERLLSAQQNSVSGKFKDPQNNPHHSAVPQDSQEVQQAQKKLEEGNKKLEEAQQKLNEQLKPLGKLDDSGGKLYELIPIIPRGQEKTGAPTEMQRNGHAWAKKWTYVRSDKVKSHFRGYKLNEEEQHEYGKNKDSIVGKDGKIDTNKLKDQLGNFHASGKFKVFEKAGVLWAKPNELIHSSLEEWANGVNAGSKHVEVKAEVQVLRYMAGASLETEWRPKDGKVALKANVQGEFAIAEGSFQAGCWFPDRSGFMWALKGPKSGTLYKIGLIRFGAVLEAKGLAGASASLYLDVELDYKDMSKGLAGVKGRPRQQANPPRQVNVGQEFKDNAGVDAGGDLFAGARIEGSIKGRVEWNSPESKGFEELASIGPALTLQAGAGLAFVCNITFKHGKFRFLMSAGACLGVGAKGKMELEVDLGKVLELTKYLAYALFATDYEIMKIIEDEAFQAWQNLSLWAIKEGLSIEQAIQGWMKDAKGSVKAVDAKVQALALQLETDFEKENARVALMEKVLAKPKELEYAPPETKGMILYQLSRHGVLDDIDSRNYTTFSFETLDRRKQAVMTVCRKARSKADFRNIMQHMAPGGAKSSEAWTFNFAAIKRFLGMKFDPNNYPAQLDALYARLYDDPVLGYAFVDNDRHEYLARLESGNHDGFMVAGGYNPGSLVPEFYDGNFGNDRGPNSTQLA